jgi:serine/threonine protein phosphatase 1
MTEKNLETTNTSRTFFVTDIHGGYRALLQVLEKSKFDKENDILICGGDVCDGWPDTVEVIEELLTIKNLVPILGNHDYWLKNFLDYGWHPEIWLRQGGYATVASYMKSVTEEVPFLIKHRDYFEKCILYYIDKDNNAYVHGGYTDKNGLGFDGEDTYIWDRSLWDKAKSAKKDKLKMTRMYNKVFIGHTSLGKNSLPQKRGNVINLDCGGGFEGALCIMNVETEEYFMSDRVDLLYPGVKGR